MAQGAKSDKARQVIGDTIASSTDSKIVASLATSKKVQSAVGGAVTTLATNKTVQKAVGNAISSAAKNPEVQSQAKNLVKGILFGK